MAQLDTRKVLNGFFRQIGKFLFIFVPLILAGILYAYSAPPDYDSSAELLIKFGQEARPEVGQNTKFESSTVDEHRELIQSNVNILSSRDLAENLLQKITIQRAYPRLASGKPPEKGTLMDAALRLFADDLVVKTESNSDTMIIHLYNHDPETAQLMLNELIDLFISKQTEIYTNPETALFQKQVQKAQDELQEAQKRLYAYKSQTGIASLDEELTLLLTQRSDLFDNYQEKIADLRAKEHELSQTYKPDSAVMTNLRKTIQSVDSDYATKNGSHTHSSAGTPADDEKAAVAASARKSGRLADLDRQIAQMEQQKSRLDDMMREIKIDEDTYKAVKLRAEESEANQILNQQKISQISIIEKPNLPYKPARPWKLAIIALCAIIGLTLGISVCIIAEGLDKRLSLPEQAAAELNTAVLASFSFSRWGKKGKLSTHELMNLYRAIETVIPDENTRVLQLVSCHYREGTTTIASELLAMAAKIWNHRSLIIELKNDDRTMPRNTPSLMDAASGKSPLAGAIISGVSLQPDRAWLTAKENTEMLLPYMDRIKQLIGTLQSQYKFIIINVPGLALDPIGVRLCSLAGNVIMVLEADRTRAPVARKVLHSLLEDKVHVIGLAFNKRRYYIPRWIYRSL